jgi:tetratricopeptide (TPR) repeat protein
MALSGLMVLALAVVLEAMGAYMLFKGAQGIEYVGAIAAHLAAAGASAEGLALRQAGFSRGKGTGLYLAGWMLGLLFPIVGPLAALLLALVLPRPKRGLPGESLEERRARAAMLAREKKRDEQQLGEGLDAIVDALKDRDPKVRLSAIDAIAGDSSKRAAQILADARENTVFDVRVRAVQALASMSKAHGERLAAAKKALLADPDSPAKYREVARLCLEYADLGVEDPTMTRLLLEQARHHAQTAIDLGGEDKETALLLARVASALGSFEEAESVYRRILRDDARDTDALLGIAEAQFARRDFALLPLTCRWVLHQAGSKLDESAIESLAFWLRGEGAVETKRSRR